MPEQVITSLRNPRVQQAARLRDRRHRDRQGRIVIDGVAELTRALRVDGLQSLELFACQELCQSTACQEIITAARRASADVFWVSRAIFEKLCFGDRADGVLGVMATPQRNLSDLVIPDHALVAVLEGIEKPGNLGAVLRSADAAGISAVIVADGGTDLFNPNAIRASLGTIFTLPLAAATSAEALEWLHARNIRLFAARVDAEIIYTRVDMRPATALVLGSETAGLTDIWNASDITPIRLPMLGAADSLNVSVAAAVLFYEAHRQRTA